MLGWLFTLLFSYREWMLNDFILLFLPSGITTSLNKNHHPSLSAHFGHHLNYLFLKTIMLYFNLTVQGHNKIHKIGEDEV